MTFTSTTPAGLARGTDVRSRAAAAFISAFDANNITGDRVSERLLIELSVLSALEVGEGTLDSHLLADVVHARRTLSGRGDANWTQTKDYIQHVLREIAHVCRYAVDEGYYRIHHAKECAPSCGDHRTRLAGAARVHQPACPDCFVEAMATGCCPLCSQPVAGASNSR